MHCTCSQKGITPESAAPEYLIAPFHFIHAIYIHTIIIIILHTQQKTVVKTTETKPLQKAPPPAPTSEENNAIYRQLRKQVSEPANVCATAAAEKSGDPVNLGSTPLITHRHSASERPANFTLDEVHITLFYFFITPPPPVFSLPVTPLHPSLSVITEVKLKGECHNVPSTLSRSLPFSRVLIMKHRTNRRYGNREIFRYCTELFLQ